MKRGASGFSMVVGINKEAGHSSHSTLGKLKRALGESRVGHAGTLDPFATGVLVALVGPAARLSNYIVSDAKSYVADIVVGRSTATDDIEGPTLSVGSPSINVWDAAYAQAVLDGFAGDIMQRPPAYSAIKRNGKKACNEARVGRIIEIEPRPVHVSQASLVEVFDVEDEGCQRPCWRVAFDVSKGTYIRSLARDIGSAVGCGAHLAALLRTRSGAVELADCVSEDLDAAGFLDAAIDPLRLLGMRATFAGDSQVAALSNGAPIPLRDLRVLSFNDAIAANLDCCISAWSESSQQLDEGERIAMIGKAGLKAIYAYDPFREVLVPECVFQVEVSRGFN